MKARTTSEKTKQEKNGEVEGRGGKGSSRLDRWYNLEKESLMSLRIDEDKMGLGSRGNNLWGFMVLLMGRVLARPAPDGQFPHLPPSGCTSPLQLK